MFHEVWELERFHIAKVTFNVMSNGAIRYATYYFLLDFHCNHVSILHRFPDIIIYFPKLKEVT